MRKYIRTALLMLVLSAASLVLCGCGGSQDTDQNTGSKADIESALDLSAQGSEWTYDDDADAWTMAPVTAVTNPQIEEEQGVSVR